MSGNEHRLENFMRNVLSRTSTSSSRDLSAFTSRLQAGASLGMSSNQQFSFAQPNGSTMPTSSSPPFGFPVPNVPLPVAHAMHSFFSSDARRRASAETPATTVEGPYSLFPTMATSLAGLAELHDMLESLASRLRPPDNSTAKSTLASLPRIVLTRDDDYGRQDYEASIDPHTRDGMNLSTTLGRSGGGKKRKVSSISSSSSSSDDHTKESGKEVAAAATSPWAAGGFGRLGVKELKSRLDAMGAVTLYSRFVEKSEFVAALENALLQHDSRASRSSSYSSSSSSSYSSSLQTPYTFSSLPVLPDLHSLPVKELLRRLRSLGAHSPASFLTKSELVGALRQAAGSPEPHSPLVSTGTCSSSTSTISSTTAAPPPPGSSSPLPPTPVTRVPISRFFGGSFNDDGITLRSASTAFSSSSSSSSSSVVKPNLSSSALISAEDETAHTCTICMEEMAVGDLVTMLPDCGHCFHLGQPLKETSNSNPAAEAAAAAAAHASVASLPSGPTTTAPSASSNMANEEAGSAATTTHRSYGLGGVNDTGSCPGILTWLRSNSSCPNCKAQLPMEQGQDAHSGGGVGGELEGPEQGVDASGDGSGGVSFILRGHPFSAAFSSLASPPVTSPISLAVPAAAAEETPSSPSSMSSMPSLEEASSSPSSTSSMPSLEEASSSPSSTSSTSSILSTTPDHRESTLTLPPSSSSLSSSAAEEVTTTTLEASLVADSDGNSAEASASKRTRRR